MISTLLPMEGILLENMEVALQWSGDSLLGTIMYWEHLESNRRIEWNVTVKYW
jgi:hypothetical protein